MATDALPVIPFRVMAGWHLDRYNLEDYEQGHDDMHALAQVGNRTAASERLTEIFHNMLNYEDAQAFSFPEMLSATTTEMRVAVDFLVKGEPVLVGLAFDREKVELARAAWDTYKQATRKGTAGEEKALYEAAADAVVAEWVGRAESDLAWQYCQALVWEPVIGALYREVYEQHGVDASGRPGEWFRRSKNPELKEGDAAPLLMLGIMEGKDFSDAGRAQYAALLNQVDGMRQTPELAPFAHAVQAAPEAFTILAKGLFHAWQAKGADALHANAIIDLCKGEHGDYFAAALQRLQASAAAANALAERCPRVESETGKGRPYTGL